MIERIVIVGAGAMGCLFAARLAQSGASVTLIDLDPERMALIDSEGLRLSDDTGDHIVPVKAGTAGSTGGTADLILVFTKGHHTRAAAESVAHLAHARSTILTLQNGVGNAELIAEVFPLGRIVVGTAHIAADLSFPNTVTSGGFGHLTIGNFLSGDAGGASAVAEVLRNAGFEAEVNANVDAVIWEKLAFNAALNGLAMITGSANGAMNDPFARRIVARLVDEALNVATARGIDLDRDRIFATIELALTQHAGHKASMLQDREARRTTEIDFINGAVIREGARLGVDTPTHAVVFDLVKFTESRDREAQAGHA